MKRVHVMFDEELLKRLDAEEEVRRVGRSAVLRRMAAEYVRRSRRRRIAEAYRRAYASGEGLANDFAGWTNERSSRQR